MAQVFKFPIAEIESIRMGKLMRVLSCGPCEAAGALLLFWHKTRSQRLEQGAVEDVIACLPTSPAWLDDSLFEGLVVAGYVRVEGELATVVDNVGHNAHVDGVTQRARHAVSVRVEKQRKVAKKAPVKKAAAQVAVVADVESHALAARRMTWEAYVRMYTRKMGQEPVRNAKSASLIKTFVERVGQKDAPDVISFFVDHPDKHYMGRLYQLELAVRDAESLRTQWANNVAITPQDMRHMEEQMAIDRDRQRILLHS